MGNIVVATESEIVSAYGVDIAGLLAKKAEYLALEFDTPANYRESSKALATVRDVPVNIEKRRKELKADSLEYGRRVDSIARKLAEPFEEIRDAMQAKKKAADDAKAAEKAAKERAEQEAIAAKIRADQEEREAQLKAEREAFETEKAAREAAEQAERDRLAAEREAFEAEQRKAREEQERVAKTEADRIAAERAKLEAEQEAARDRLARIESEKLAAEQAARAIVEAEEKRVAELERVAKLKAREEAARPDKEKLRAFEAKILELAKTAPTVADAEAIIALDQCIRGLGIARGYLQDYAGEN